MAGIGFELKRLFDKSGLVNKAKAYTYSSLVTIGPMLSCIALISIVQWLLVEYDGSVSFLDRELFLACVVYAFTFSYIATNLTTMFITRTISDFIYQGYYGALLPSFHGSLMLNYAIGGVPALIVLAFADMTLAAKVALYVFYMTLITIWTQTIFITAMKDFRKIGNSFVIGAVVSLGSVVCSLELLELYSLSAVLFAIDIGFAVTAALLFVQIERFYKTDKSKDKEMRISNFAFFAYIRKYPSLLAIGGLTVLGLYSHQFIQWMGPSGRLVGNSFRLAPEYDIAVYYAFISAIPSLIMFVVSLETFFYEKFRSYYNAILTRGSIAEINAAKRDIQQVVAQQLTMIMGVQLFFSIVAIALGIRFLPYIGFTSGQIDVFNILVIGFYSYIIFSIVTLILLYFDDRKGVVSLAAVFLALNVVFTAISVVVDEQGFSFFAASFVTLLLSIGRLILLLRRLNYYTFSAQPLVSQEYDNRYTRMLKRSQAV